jgi:hypothetical protein
VGGWGALGAVQGQGGVEFQQTPQTTGQVRG